MLPIPTLTDALEAVRSVDTPSPGEVLELVRQDERTRLAVIFAAVFAFSFGFVLGFVLGNATAGEDEANTQSSS